MGNEYDKNEIPAGDVRGKQNSGEHNPFSRSGSDGRRDLKVAGNLPIGIDRALVEREGEENSKSLASPGQRLSVRLRVNPATHGGTLGLLIKKAERRKQSIRRSIAMFEDQLRSLRIELDHETEDLAELNALLANWQANIDRLRQIREEEIESKGSE